MTLRLAPEGNKAKIEITGFDCCGEIIMKGRSSSNSSMMMPGFAIELS
jgi:hypothetical protein